MKHYIAVLCVLVPLSGCVTMGKFKAQEARLGSIEEELNSFKTELVDNAEAAKMREEELLSKIKALSEQLASVEKSNNDLRESLEAKKGELTKKVAELTREKDALSQKLADAAAEIAELRKTKDEEIAALLLALEEKKALEEAKKAELAEVKKNYEELTTNLKSEIAAGAVTITQLKNKLTVNMVDRILFDSGFAEMKPGGKKVLKRIGKILNNVKDKDIRIEGHTDNVPIGGDLKDRYPTNWELSSARATAVLRYLQDKAKVDPRRLGSVGYGEHRPVADNDTPENRVLNRRIEIILVPANK